MTNESDSLNAFRGMLTAYEAEIFPEGFICGMPLHSHVYILAWVHKRNVVPKRRPALPSWSWADDFTAS